MIITRRTLTASALVATTTLVLGVCGSSKPQTPAAAPTAEVTTAAPTQSATPASVPTVPGYRSGEIPPIPLFSVPTIDVFASNTDKAIVQTASSSLASIPGMAAFPAECGGAPLVSGPTILGGDGSAVSSSDKGAAVNSGTGSGIITEGSIFIVYGGDGSGTYSNADTMATIAVETDGSGTYSTTTVSITLDNSGGDNYSSANPMESIINNGDGSGQFSKGTVMVINNGDDTDSYPDGKLTIQNNDNSAAIVNGVTVNNAPRVGKVSKLGKFPAVESLKPVESCGTVITLEGGVLFDFGESDIHPETAQTLKSLADVLNDAKVPTTHVYGHTDSISGEAFNLQLSQERADTVSTEPKKDNVSATLDTTDYGESRPAASNENADDSGNPTGRALNRRIKIFTPAF